MKWFAAPFGVVYTRLGALPPKVDAGAGRLSIGIQQTICNLPVFFLQAGSAI